VNGVGIHSAEPPISSGARHHRTAGSTPIPLAGASASLKIWQPSKDVVSRQLQARCRGGNDIIVEFLQTVSCVGEQLTQTCRDEPNVKDAMPSILSELFQRSAHRVLFGEDFDHDEGGVHQVLR